MEIYPGERFTVLIDPDPGWDGTLPCEFWSMVDETLESVENIHIRDAALTIEAPPFISVKGYPNPTRKHITWDDARQIEVWNAYGATVADLRFERGVLDVAGWPVGTYVARIDGRRSVRFVVIE